MTTFSDIAIIFNPNSTGDAPGNARRLRADLQKSLPDVPVKLLPTKYAGHARKLAFDFALSHQQALIISASGDGGYNEVINGALQAQTEGAKPICAVLPSGNANDHARTTQRKPLLGLILDNHVTRFDVLLMSTYHKSEKPTTRYAHSYIGIGLTPKVAQELNKEKLNTLTEGRIIVRTFWRLRPVRIRRGGRIQLVDSLICSIIPEMAKVLTLSPQARPQTGLFEVATIRHNSKLRLLLRLIKGAVINFGAERSTDAQSFTLLQPSPIQLDGEIVQLPKNTTVDITICPMLLRTIANG